MISGKSVKRTGTPHTAAAESPTKPVPEPSSRIREEGGGRRWRRFDRRYEDAQVLWPRVSDVRAGSCKVISMKSCSVAAGVLIPELADGVDRPETKDGVLAPEEVTDPDSPSFSRSLDESDPNTDGRDGRGILNVLFTSPLAVRPHRSAIRSDAESRINSASSSVIHDNGEEMTEMSHFSKPSGAEGVEVGASQLGGGRVKCWRTASRVAKEGRWYRRGKSRTVEC
jgi:hypothetical protein